MVDILLGHDTCLAFALARAIVRYFYLLAAKIETVRLYGLEQVFQVLHIFAKLDPVVYHQWKLYCHSYLLMLIQDFYISLIHLPHFLHHLLILLMFVQSILSLQIHKKSMLVKNYKSARVLFTNIFDRFSKKL